ncbi:MAG: PulJ/GspJ family protein [Limnochordia bacterium]|jgi:type II secretory pathway component PulJ
MRLRHVDVKSPRGITLVETLVALSLLGIMIATSHSAYIFIIRSLARLSQQAATQQEARLIARALADDLRYAYEIEVLQAVPPEPSADDIFVFSQHGQVIRRTAEGDLHIGNISGDLPTTLHFVSSKNANGESGNAGNGDSHNGVSTRHITMEITVASGSRTFTLRSPIILLNAGSETNGSSDVSGPVLRYRVFSG